MRSCAMLRCSVGGILVMLTLAAPAAKADLPTYSVVDLGVFNGLTTGINDYGQVAGWQATVGGTRPFVWTPTTRNGITGSLSFPAGLDGATSSDAWGINESGELVGRSNSRAVFWNPTTPNGGTYGPPVELTQPGAPALLLAGGVNSFGQIVGRSDGIPFAFLFTPTSPGSTTGSVFNLGTLPGAAISFATSINDYGQVAGTSGHPFVWTPDTPNGTTGHMVGVPAQSSQVQIAINATGSIAGSYTPGLSFVWTPDTPHASTGSFVDLGTLPNSQNTLALSLNQANEVVGYVVGRSDVRGFLWTPAAGMVDLNTLLDPGITSGWSVTNAFAINNLEQIGAVANFTQPGGKAVGHFVLLMPRVAADANGDGVVGFDDLVILARHYGVASGATWQDGDFNGDGSAGFDDLVILARNYGRSLAGIQPAGRDVAFGNDAQNFAEFSRAVPGPASISLSGVAALLILLRERRPQSYATSDDLVRSRHPSTLRWGAVDSGIEA